MPNLAFHYEVLNQVIDSLVSQGDPDGTLMNKHKQAAVLGAMGPDLLRYRPISSALSNQLFDMTQTIKTIQTSKDPNPPPLPSITDLPDFLELVMRPLGGAYSLIFRTLVLPTWPVFQSLGSFLDKMDSIVQQGPPLGTVELLQIYSSINDISSQLSSQKGLSDTMKAVTVVISQIVAISPLIEQNNPVAPPGSIASNRIYEFLRWHGTGDFARNLLQNATSDAQKAYALGYLGHVSASVTGEPFVNNITGGPYRTHWWRNRWVSNYVDAWTFGFYESNAQMNGDEPTPEYSKWVNLCTANLQNQFNVGNFDGTVGDTLPDSVLAMAYGTPGPLSSKVPVELGNLLTATLTDTYSALPLDGFSAEEFQKAVVGAFSVYWFMTSGAGIFGVKPPGDPPSNCTTAPSWITSSGSSPSPQQIGVNPPGVGCALLMAIFAMLEFLSGDIPEGLMVMEGVLEAPSIDWGKLHCNLFWLRTTLAMNAGMLRDALVLGGLAYPFPEKLGTMGPGGKTQPAIDLSPSLKVALCVSNEFADFAAFGILYPALMDASNPKLKFADTNYPSFPLAGTETGTEKPPARNLVPAGQYPNFIVNGAGLLNGGILQNGAFPSADQFFGDTVSNAIAAIQNDAKGLPNYNLDGDRGYGWKAWSPQPGSVPQTPPVVVVQDA